MTTSSFSSKKLSFRTNTDRNEAPIAKEVGENEWLLFILKIVFYTKT
jgi:hypothetical protein